MPVVAESIIVNRPPQRVFEYISTSEYVPLWDTSILTVQQLGDEPLAVGTRLRGTSSVLGRRFDWTTEVVELDPPYRMSSTTVEGSLDFTVTFTLTPVSGGRTKVSFCVDATSGTDGVFGRLADSFVQKAQSRTARANLARLADLVCGPGASAAAAQQVRARHGKR